jgi:hypothetical protein
MNPDDLTPQECAIMLGLVREGVRKAHRSRARGLRRWGEAYDQSSIDRRIEILQNVYVRLGGDARRISERVTDDASTG